ncbi:MAG TPA: cytochrome c [Acidimicrobiales bacterium]|nr:cytochrome c [Acidimicrobiales bacterium]
MFAATTQQTIALVVLIAAAIGWVVFLVANSRKAKPEVGSEIELAPNRKPYLDDEELEGPHLERVLLWGVLSLMVIGVGLPLYWVTEPNRQRGAVEYFDERLAGVTYHHGQPVGGGALFAATDEGGFNCAGCHGGMAAIGGEVPYTLTDPVDGSLRQVQWKAPRLDTATLKFSDDQLRDILVYGRPFSPMPAWGIEGGGPMNDQQIDNLVRYLHKLARDAGLTGADGIAKAQAISAEEVDAEIERLRSAGGDQPATMGAALFNLHCARCHTKGWSYNEPEAPGGGGFGPSLFNVESQFTNPDDHYDFVANGRQRGERYGENGQASGRMPYFINILTEEQIRAIVDYERSLRQGS